MAIEEFGKSLLADVRKRKDDQARAMAKQEEKNAWAALGANVLLSGAESYLKQNTKEFLSNQNFAIADAQQKRHLRNVSSINDIQAQLDASKKTEEDFFLDQYALPAWVAKAQETYEGYKFGDDEAIDDWIRTNAKEQNAEIVAAWKEARNAVDLRSETQDEYDARIAKIVAKGSPTSIGGWLTSKATGFFSGMSQEEMQKQATMSLIEGKYAKDKTIVEALVTKFQQTKSSKEVDKLGQKLTNPFPELEGDEMYDVSRDAQVQSVDGKLVIIPKITKKAKYGRGKESPTTEFLTDEKYILNLKDPESLAKGAYDLMGGRVALKDFKDAISPEGWIEFIKRMDEKGVNIYAPTSVQQIATIGSQMQEIGSNEIYMLDPQVIAFTNAFGEGMVKVPGMIEGLTARYENSPEKDEKTMGEFLVQNVMGLNKYNTVAGSRGRQPVAIPTPPPVPTITPPSTEPAAKKTTTLKLSDITKKDEEEEEN